MLRLWEEPIEQDQIEIRFKVQHVLSREVRYFRKWSDVIAFMVHHFQSTEHEAWNNKEDSQ